MMRRVACALSLCLAVAGACRADALFGDFNILNGAQTTSGGHISFVLNANGTIRANFESFVGPLRGFGFDSTFLNVPESHFSTNPDNLFGWSDDYGEHRSGFFSSESDDDESWIIGNPGQYSSVFDVVGGGHATHNFFFVSDDFQDQWAADGISVPTPAPEPASFMLMGTAILGLGYGFRRKSS